MNVRAQSVLHWVLLVILAVINLGAALGKGLDMPGFVKILETYQLFPAWSQWPLAVAAVVAELMVGVWLLSGIRQVQAAWACAAINMGYAVVLTIEFIRGIELASCGCFGVFLSRPLRWYSPLEDLVLVGASLIVAATAAARIRRRNARIDPAPAERTIPVTPIAGRA